MADKRTYWMGFNLKETKQGAGCLGIMLCIGMVYSIRGCYVARSLRLEFAGVSSRHIETLQPFAFPPPEEKEGTFQGKVLTYSYDGPPNADQGHFELETFVHPHLPDRLRATRPEEVTTLFLIRSYDDHLRQSCDYILVDAQSGECIARSVIKYPSVSKSLSRDIGRIKEWLRSKHRP